MAQKSPMTIYKALQTQIDQALIENILMNNENQNAFSLTESRLHNKRHVCALLIYIHIILH